MNLFLRLIHTIFIYDEAWQLHSSILVENPGWTEEPEGFTVHKVAKLVRLALSINTIQMRFILKYFM